MNEFDLGNLDQAVADFQNTIDALKSIQTISEHVIEAAGQIGASGADLKKSAEEMSDLSGRIAEEVQRFSAEANSRVQQVEQFFQVYGATVTKEISNTVESTNALREENFKLEKQIQDYTINTQKSVDEMRITTNNNTRELRERFSITEERIKSEVGGRLGVLKSLADDVNSLKTQQKKTETLTWVAVVGAVFAAISSLVHFFI